jgi:hypothetical protein
LVMVPFVVADGMALTRSDGFANDEGGGGGASF